MKTALVTGIGTIGTEFIKQLLDRGYNVTAVDRNEWAVATAPEHHNLNVKLAELHNIKGKYDLIVHTAAYKHIEICESNRKSCWANNVVESIKLYNNTKGKILFISTDKAVEYSSYYGKTKSDGEDITKERGGVIARLGNVLASSGSVIPKWEQCIEEGKPLKVTDLKMTRYFIPVEEAVTKILDLLPHAKPGQVIIPEMGKPVKLNDIIIKVLQKKDKELDYPIDIIGLRPGEKLEEKLKWDHEKEVFKNEQGGIYV